MFARGAAVGYGLHSPSLRLEGSKLVSWLDMPGRQPGRTPSPTLGGLVGGTGRARGLLQVSVIVSPQVYGRSTGMRTLGMGEAEEASGLELSGES